MLRKIFNGIWLFFRVNLVFGLGMIVGSVIGTCTTLAITYGLSGQIPNIQLYCQTICGV